MKKNIAKVGVAGLVLLGITECHMITAPAVLADTYPSQKLEVAYSPLNVFDAIKPVEFSRFQVVIAENVNPWLDPEIAAVPLSQDEVRDLLEEVGFSGYSLKMAQAIVFLESTNRVYAHNPNHLTGDNSYGLFQINMFKDLEEARLEKYGLERNEDLFDPIVNATIAYQISGGGTSWSAWTTYPKAKAIVGNY